MAVEAPDTGHRARHPPVLRQEEQQKKMEKDRGAASVSQISRSLTAWTQVKMGDGGGFLPFTFTFTLASCPAAGKTRNLAEMT